MAESFRVLNTYNITEISKRLEIEKQKLILKTENSIRDTVIFARAASVALGEISITEAQEGIIEYFKERMRIE